MKHVKFTLFLGILMSMIGHHLYAHDIEVANSDGKTIYYNFNSDGSSVSVTYRGSSTGSYSNEYTGSVVIPENVTYEGKTYRVTSIGKYAFSGCGFIFHISIPLSVTTIKEGAFRGCGMNNITIPPSVEEISDYTFAGCDEMVVVYLPPSIIRIGQYAFGACSNLSSIIIPENVEEIGQEAFYECENLHSVTFLSSVKTVGKSAFYGCENLNKVIVPDIDKWCSIDFASSWSNPLVYAKHLYSSENKEITNVVISQGVTKIGERAFERCEGITSVTIPSSVTSIGSLAFFACINLKQISLPPNITVISPKVFESCQNISNIVIPTSVTEIGYEAFEGCTNLTEIEIPSNVKVIGKRAFYGCSRLNKNILPSSIQTIEDAAFDWCKKLTSIYCLSENPISINSTVFSYEIFQTCTLYVPKGTKEKYQNAEVWKYFSVIKEFDPLEIENKEVNVILSSAGYATFYNAYNNFKIPVGLSAQVVTFDSYGNLSYNTIANGIIPKGIPVILKSNDKKGGTYTLTSTTESATYSGENLLHGSSSQTMTSNVNGVSTSGNSSYVYYKLAYGKSGSVNANKFGWYWGANNGAAFSIEGGKAWLALPITNAHSKRAVLFIDDDMSIDDVTSIDEIEQSRNGEANSIQYNMAGQRVDNSYNGIIIVNGKKIVR